MNKEQTYWFIFIGNTILLQKNGDNYFIPLEEACPVTLKEWTPRQELPDMDGHKCVACQIDTPSDEVGNLHTVGLRESWPLLPYHVYQMAGKAYELLYWNSNTRYCGNCGAPMKRSTVISKKCTHCGKEVWPQVSPAIIVRIHKGDSILLVNAKTFRRSEMYGLVAGFLETGEALEECVRREVREETGIEIDNIKYFGSQPWPYPCGVMIGFTADYKSGEISIQEEELNRAGWFNKSNMPPIPDKMSIARWLIDDYLEKSKQ